MTSRELLEPIDQVDEQTRVEVTAVANEPGTGGGWIVLGATPDEHALSRRYVATGMSDPDRISRDFASTFNQPVRVQITASLVNGQHRLSDFVPETEAPERPSFFKNHPLPAGPFRRIESAAVRNTDDNLTEFYQERCGESCVGTVRSDADLSAIDPAAVAECRDLRGDADLTAEEFRWTDDEVLHARRCATWDDAISHPAVRGKGAQTCYVPTEKLLAPWQARETRSSALPGSATLSGNPPAQAGNLPVAPEVGVTRFALPPGLPEDLQADLTALKKRVPPTEMEALVWRLCHWKACSAEEIAALLRRERKYIQDTQITPMLRAGRLELTIPDQPNHPQQQYRATVAPGTTP